MRKLTFLATGAALLAAIPAHAAPTLVGFAELPADTFYDGPTSGQFGVGGNGRTGRSSASSRFRASRRSCPTAAAAIW